MPYDPHIHHRRSIRLKEYDYRSNGMYFVTLCVSNRECLFGEIENGIMMLNPYGKIIEFEWQQTCRVRSNVDLDVYVIMPNHLHGILVLHDDVAGKSEVTSAEKKQPTGPLPGSIGAIIGQIKRQTTVSINALRGTPRTVIWQRNYYEHIVRGDEDLQRIRTYIEANPTTWLEDSLYT